MNKKNYLDITLTHTHGLHFENHKMIMKEIKRKLKYGETPYSKNKRLNIIKTSILLPQLIYRFTAIPSKMPA